VEARLVEQSQAVLTGTEAVARVERTIAADAVARDPAVAEGLAMAGVRAASLLEGPSGGAADGVAVSQASCVHHVHAPPGFERGGAFELAAGSVQQATDHCLAAHLLSRRLGRAGICSLAPSLAQDLKLVSLPEAGLIAALLAAEAGAPETDASPERIVELAREVLRAVGDRTARPGNLVEVQGDGAAEVVLVASGADTVPAREAARALSEAGVAASALSVVLVRPFPKAEVRDALGASRLVFVVHTPGEPSALLAGVRGSVGEKTEVHALAAADPTQMIEAVRKLLPAGSFEEQKLAAAPEATPSRRLVVAPEGPWGEETARGALAALGRLVALRVGRSVDSQLGATVLHWDSSEIPEPDTDLLLASYPAALEAKGALGLLRPRSAVVVLGEVESSQELMRLLSSEAWQVLREKELRVHWVAPPVAPGEAPSDQVDRAASQALAGAALTAVRQPVDPAQMAGEIAPGDDEASRWLREGATAVQALDPAALETPPPPEELSFGTKPELPRMPDPVDEPEETKRQAQWIRRFHRLGARTFDPAPRLPVRPAVLDGLAATLRETSPDPFVLVPSEDVERPVAARGLRELLDEALDDMEAGGWDPGALAGNLGALAVIAARVLEERGPGADLDSLLPAAGDELASKLGVMGDELDTLRGRLEELRRRLPGQGRVLGLGADTPLRLYRNVLEAVRAPLRKRFTAQLERHRERLRDLLELDRMSSSAGRTPEALTAQLGGAGADLIDLSALSQTLPSRPGPAQLDEDRRKRVEEALATIESHLEQQGQLPGVVFLHPPEVDLPLPGEEREEHPDPLAAAVGYFDGTARRLATVFRAARVATLEAQGNYRPEFHDEVLADMDWEGFSADELALVPLVAVVTTGRSLRQRGQGSLSRLLRSSRPVHVIVLDEVGATDEAEDLSAFHLDLGYLVMAHREAFAVGSNLARPDRLTEGLVRMVRAPRPGVALIELPARELASWQVLMADAALRGRACPAFLYDPDAGTTWAERFELDGNPDPECTWPSQSIRYLEQGEEKTLEAAFTFADAVALEPAYLRHLRVIPPVAWDDEVQQPLADYVEALDQENRQPGIPYLWVIDEAENLQRAVVTRDLAIACRDRVRGWRILQEFGGYENSYAQRAATEAREQVLAEAAQERAELEEAHAEELAGARGEGARESMERLAEVLMNPTALSAAAPAPAAVAPTAAPAVEPEAEQAAAPAEEELPEEEAISFDEPYIDAPLCTTCNECTNINPRLFQYNANKQAFIADASAGTFAELVKAAELCPARCIHPGKPRSDDSTATPDLVDRAAKFN
jgi:ferredoxin